MNELRKPPAQRPVPTFIGWFETGHLFAESQWDPYPKDNKIRVPPAPRGTCFDNFADSPHHTRPLSHPAPHLLRSPSHPIPTPVQVSRANVPPVLHNNNTALPSPFQTSPNYTSRAARLRNPVVPAPVVTNPPQPISHTTTPGGPPTHPFHDEPGGLLGLQIYNKYSKIKNLK